MSQEQICHHIMTNKQLVLDAEVGCYVLSVFSAYTHTQMRLNTLAHYRGGVLNKCVPLHHLSTAHLRGGGCVSAFTDSHIPHVLAGHLYHQVRLLCQRKEPVSCCSKQMLPLPLVHKSTLSKTTRCLNVVYHTGSAHVRFGSQLQLINCEYLKYYSLNLTYV